MRIIAGTAKGRILKSLRGRALRPTADRVRESLFGVLGRRVAGARFLDLYAGAGTVGLEALSRGAAEATFVESHRPAGRIIEENAQACGFADRSRVIIAPVGRALAILRRQAVRFDLIFADPPYDRGEVGVVLARIGQRLEMLSEGGWLLVQRSRREEPGMCPLDMVKVRSLRYGETIVDVYTRSEEAEEPGVRKQD